MAGLYNQRRDDRDSAIDLDHVSSHDDDDPGHESAWSLPAANDAEVDNVSAGPSNPSHVTLFSPDVPPEIASHSSPLISGTTRASIVDTSSPNSPRPLAALVSFSPAMTKRTPRFKTKDDQP